MEMPLMFILWIIVLAGGFLTAKGFILTRECEGKVWESPAGVGRLVLLLALTSILAYAWFQLLSTLIAPWFLSPPSAAAPTVKEQYDALIRLPRLFDLAWLVVALVLVALGRKPLSNTLFKRCPLTSWQRFVVLGAIASFLQQLFILPQRLLLYLLHLPVPLFPISPRAQIIGINALVAVILLSLFYLTHHQTTQ